MSVMPNPESLQQWIGTARRMPLKLLASAVIVGLAAGLAGVGFHYLIHVIERFVLRSHASPVDALVSLPWYWKAGLPALGGLLMAPMVFTWVREARGHGVPEVMEAVVQKGGHIRGRVAVVKSLASSITIGTGGSVGSEGPVVQIGAALGSKIGRLLKLPTDSVISLVGCGVAGAIAAVFNAPMAGAFFALETILGNFAAPIFAPIVVASVTGTAVSRAFLGNYPAFQIPAYKLVSVAEIPLYAVLGLFAGIIAVLFIRVLYWTEDRFGELPGHPYLRPLLGGLLVGICLLFIPQVYGTGFDTMTDALVHGLPVTLLLLLIPFKIFATSVTLGSGGSGGVFTPSLFLGAILGSLCGIAFDGVFPTVTGPIGAYALVGMGAVLAGATKTPITAILLLFEITGDYEIILPIMVACVIATLVASVLHSESIYTLKLARMGLSSRLDREEMVMRSYHVRDVMRPSSRTVSPGMPLKELITEFLASRYNERYVVDQLGRYSGFIDLNDIKDAMEEEGLDELVVAGDLAHSEIPLASPDITLSECMDLFLKAEATRLPVVDPETGQFLGTISEHDVISLYKREILKKDFLGTLSYEGRRRDYIQLPTGYQVSAVSLPLHMAGRSLRELSLRASYKLSVVAIKHAGEEKENDLPNPEIPLQKGDVLVVVGNAEDIHRFQHARPEDEVPRPVASHEEDAPA